MLLALVEIKKHDGENSEDKSDCTGDKDKQHRILLGVRHQFAPLVKITVFVIIYLVDFPGKQVVEPDTFPPVSC